MADGFPNMRIVFVASVSVELSSRWQCQSKMRNSLSERGNGGPYLKRAATGRKRAPDSRPVLLLLSDYVLLLLLNTLKSKKV